MNLDKNSVTGFEKYKEYIEKYYKEALKCKEMGDKEQAAEKI